MMLAVLRRLLARLGAAAYQQAFNAETRFRNLTVMRRSGTLCKRLQVRLQRPDLPDNSHLPDRNFRCHQKRSNPAPSL